LMVAREGVFARACRQIRCSPEQWFEIQHIRPLDVAETVIEHS
jgi:hypothetical protein